MIFIIAEVFSNIVIVKMANDPIASALAKGDAKFQSLQAKTSPIYDKMENGTFSRADLKALKALYAEQSKAAAKTFEESTKAIEKSAKVASESIVKKAVKGNQLLNTKELNVIIKSAYAKAYQQSAEQLKSIMDDALQGLTERVDQKIEELKKLVVSDQAVINQINEFAIKAMPTLDKIAAIKNADFETLLDPRVRRRFLKARDKTLADEIVTRTLIGVKRILDGQDIDDDSSRKKSKWKNPISKAVDQVKSIYKDENKSTASSQKLLTKTLQTATTLKSFVQSVMFRLNQLQYSNNMALALPNGGEISYNTMYDITSQFADQVALDDDSNQAKAQYNFEELKDRIRGFISEGFERVNQDKEGKERVNIDALAQRMRSTLRLDKIEQSLDSIKNKTVPLIKRPVDQVNHLVYTFAKETHIKNLEQKYKDHPERLEKFLKKLERVESRKDKGKRGLASFEKMRATIMKDVRKQWQINIKRSATSYYNTITNRAKRSAALTKAKKVAKFVGFMYLAALLLKGLRTFFPNWRETLSETIGNTTKAVLSTSLDFAEKYLPTIMSETAKFMINNTGRIAKLVFVVTKHVLGTIVDEFIRLLFGNSKHMDDTEKGAKKDKEERERKNTLFANTDFNNELQKRGISVTQARNYFSNVPMVRQQAISGRSEDGVKVFSKELSVDDRKFLDSQGKIHNIGQSNIDLPDIIATPVQSNAGSKVAPEIVKASPVALDPNVTAQSEKATSKMAGTTLAQDTHAGHYNETGQLPSVGASYPISNGKGGKSTSDIPTSASSNDMAVLNFGLLNDA